MKADDRQAEHDWLPTKVFATAESLGAVNIRSGDARERGCCEPRARNLLIGPDTMTERMVKGAEQRFVEQNTERRAEQGTLRSSSKSAQQSAGHIYL